MQRICGSLAEFGYEVVLVGRLRSFSKDLVEQNFQQRRLKCFFDKGKLFYLEYNLRLFFLLLFSRFDVICAIDMDTLLPAYLVSILRRKKIVYDAHEYFSQTPEVVRRPRVRKVWEFLERTIIPKLAYCYTVGEGLAGIFSEKYQTPFAVIRNVPFALPKATNVQKKTIASDQTKVILYQGVLNEGRGLAEMIQVMPDLVGAELWLAGEGDLSDELRKLVQQLELDNKVRFLGYLRPSELKQITAQSYIGLNLLENKGLNYFYSLANKTFDYIQQEIPAIHMAFPEYHNINEHFEIGILIDDLQKQNLLPAVRRLLEEDVFYQQLKANCALAKLHFTWEKEAQKLKAFYQKIVPIN
jgi:Glycosyltransferase